jgi:hypothetical protein
MTVENNISDAGTSENIMAQDYSTEENVANMLADITLKVIRDSFEANRDKSAT